MQRLSIRAYARHRGVSNTAVHQAIKTGRISQESDGRIDPDKADEQWERNTHSRRNRCQAMSHAALDGIKAVLKDHNIFTDNHHLQGRVANDILRAQRRYLAEQIEQGELMDRHTVYEAIVGVASKTYQAWLNWSVRVAAPIAHELGIDDYFLRILLTDYVREHLADLTDDPDSLHGYVQPRH